jgi:hypothetical protein
VSEIDDKIEAEVEFFDELSHPSASNEMDFVIENETEDPELTFSVEGLEAIERRMRAFIAARIKAEWERSGKAPKKMRLQLGVSFGEGSVRWNPWYELPDVADGGTRIEALRDLATGEEERA